MRITAIEPRRKGLSAVYIDGEFAMKLDTQTLLENRADVGREISDEGKTHYHMALLLNGQKVESPHYVFKDMERILNNVAGPGGSINHCDNGHRNGIMVKRDDPDPHNLEEVQRQMSYLAKKEQKSNVKGKTFFTSRIKKNK